MSNRLGPGDLVVIAGGGISGLALAAALQSRPADRRPEVVAQALDLSSQVMGTLSPITTSWMAPTV